MIELVQSEWASPVLLAPKKEDGTLRFCIDFRRLNTVTISDTYPLPRMEDCFDSLGEARLFTTLDALWGYWQVSIAECDRDKTTFTTHMGTFRYKRHKRHALEPEGTSAYILGCATRLLPFSAP